MNRKTVSGMMVTLLLVGTLLLAFSIQPVKADWTWTETIYIRADGSVNPDTAPISTVDNITYTLTDNIVGDIPYDSSAIVIERDHILVNGAGYRVKGNGALYSSGIDISYKNNVTIKNMRIETLYAGIHLSNSFASSAYGNNVSNNRYGIWLEYSSNCSVYGNSATNSAYAGIELYRSSGNSVYGNGASNNTGSGISLHQSLSCSVYGNNASNNWIGILLSPSTNSSVHDNSVTNSLGGIWLVASSDCSICGNNASDNVSFGIALTSSNDNTIMGNNAGSNTQSGIGLSHSSDNKVTDNNLGHNGYGVRIEYSSNNRIFHNNFIESTGWQAFIYQAPSNIWDDGCPSGGNHWSDYEERYPSATEMDGSGIWDTPYVIDVNNQDNYPLMEPWTPLPRTIGELKAEIEELGSEDEIDNQGIVNSLIAKLNVAQKLVDDGKIDQAENILNAFINEVQAQSGKHITPDASEILIESAEHILSNL